ncbi:MAG: hypothetical protein ACXWC4_24615 [Telluria sp.]
MLSDFSLPGNDSAAGAALYIAGTVVLTVWMRRKEFRQGGRAGAIAMLDLLSSISLAIPALAYWNTGLAARVGDGPLRLLFVLGVIGLLGFVVHDASMMLRHPRLSERQRRRLAAIGAAAVLMPSALEVWWGAEALAHLHASPEELAKIRSLTPV